MEVLFDWGNTRLKWRVYENLNQLVAQGAVLPTELDVLALQLKDFPLSYAWGASVVSLKLRESLQNKIKPSIHWLSSQKECLGILNNYDKVAEQGVDRFLAVVGARSLQASGPLVVALAGTALTVEALDAHNVYLGGMILPGQQLMLQSLAKGTEQLDRSAGLWQNFPTNTPNALMTGVIEAHVGAIMNMKARLQALHGESEVGIILSGGDALLLQQHLPSDSRFVEQLVLDGLLRVILSWQNG